MELNIKRRHMNIFIIYYHIVFYIFFIKHRDKHFAYCTFQNIMSISLKGKVTVLNHLAVAPLIYVASVVDTPKRATQEIDNATQSIYIWNGSTSKIA